MLWLHMSELCFMLQAQASRVRFGLLDGTWVDVAALHLRLFTRVKFLTYIFFTVYCYIFYHFIKCLRPQFVAGLQIVDGGA